MDSRTILNIVLLLGLICSLLYIYLLHRSTSPLSFSEKKDANEIDDNVSFLKSNYDKGILMEDESELLNLDFDENQE